MWVDQRENRLLTSVRYFVNGPRLEVWNARELSVSLLACSVSALMMCGWQWPWLTALRAGIVRSG